MYVTFMHEILYRRKNHNQNKTCMLKDILYFQQNTTFGLTERYIYTLASELDRSKFRVHLMYPDVPQLESFAVLKTLGVELHSLPRKVVEDNIFRLIPTIYKSLRAVEPDLIHYNDPVIAGMLAGRIYSKAGIVMTHHTPELDRNYAGSGKILEKLAFSGPIKVIFTSKEDCHTGVKFDGMSQWETEVVPYGVDVSMFDGTYNKKAVYDEFDIPSHHRIIANVARLVEQKGHKYLIDAAKIVLNKHENVTFLIVGDGNLRKNLMSYAEYVGVSERCVFAGYRTDIATVLKACDMFVMPSLFEGLCMAVMEAFAAGLPVVATPVGGIPSTVIDGETGVLVPVRNINKLSQAMISILDNPTKAKQMGLAGKHRMSTYFTVDKMVRRTESVYDNTLRN